MSVLASVSILSEDIVDSTAVGVSNVLEREGEEIRAWSSVMEAFTEEDGGGIIKGEESGCVTILFLGSTLFLISSFRATSPFPGSLCYAYHHYLLILGPLTFTVCAL